MAAATQRALTAMLCGLVFAACALAAPPADPHWLDIEALQDAMRSGELDAATLVQHQLDRIEALDRAGPRLGAVVEINPDAPSIAAALDRERAQNRVRGPLHGIPVLIKDNIDSGDRMLTTAGSLALVDSRPRDDAFLVRRLRESGAVILGKTNLSEWANMRSTRATSGWSARGGQTLNPWGEDRNPCGSSAGSAVAVAAALATVAVGTETDGSIVCPASATSVVGFKPTVGLISRDGIVPIAISQDTAGPMARSVRDAALLLQALAAWDANDPAAQSERALPDFAAALDAQALRGARIGVARTLAGFHPGVDALFEQALRTLRAAGAVLVDPLDLQVPETLADDELTVLLHEFRLGIERYLAGRDAPPRRLAELIAFNRRNAEREMPHFGQELFLRAQALESPGGRAYRRALARARRAAERALDVPMRRHRLDAIVAPTLAPAWKTDYVLGDHYVGGGASTLPAVAGYPHLSLPMGSVSGLPVGLSFIGGAWRDAELLGLGYAYEQHAGLRLRPPLADAGVVRE